TERRRRELRIERRRKILPPITHLYFYGNFRNFSVNKPKKKRTRSTKLAL
ncbi:unnamed protein product, partial [Brassica oleracea]